jgi:polynucleotide 5'-kinase involved in rRNA processing
VKSLSLRLLAIEEQGVAPIRQGEEGGVLLGLYDSQRKFLGIGILCKVDYMKKTLKLLTSVSEKPSSITLGKVWLDKNLKEIPISLEEIDDLAS